MKGTRKAKPGEQLFRFCYQTQPSKGLASNGIHYDLTKGLRVAAGVRDYHNILDLGQNSCVYSHRPVTRATRYDLTLSGTQVGVVVGVKQVL